MGDLAKIALCSSRHWPSACFKGQKNSTDVWCKTFCPGNILWDKTKLCSCVNGGLRAACFKKFCLTTRLIYHCFTSCACSGQEGHKSCLLAANSFQLNSQMTFLCKNGTLATSIQVQSFVFQQTHKQGINRTGTVRNNTQAYAHLSSGDTQSCMSLTIYIILCIHVCTFIIIIISNNE